MKNVIVYVILGFLCMIFTHVMCKHAHVWRTEADTSQLHQLLPILIFETDLALAGYAGWPASSKDLSLPLLCWDYRGSPLWPAFQLGTKNPNSEPSARAPRALHPNPSFLGFCNRVSKTPSWPQIHYAAKDGLELLDPLASTS